MPEEGFGEGEGGGGGGGGEGGGEMQESRPPVTEDQRWRKRALDAEAALKEIEANLTAAREELRLCREALDAAERRRQIDAALWEAGAADLEVARLLTELAVGKMDEPDVALAVEELKANKPFLFRRSRAPTAPTPGAGDAPPESATMSGRVTAQVAPGPDLTEAAALASESGDRAALLRYLRLRRGAW